MPRSSLRQKNEVVSKLRWQRASKYFLSGRFAGPGDGLPVDVMSTSKVFATPLADQGQRDLSSSAASYSASIQVVASSSFV